MENIQTVAATELLRNQIRGTILLPGDAEYEEKRLGWNRSVDQHPAVIVVVQDAQDVQAAVRFARGHNLGIAVQTTGHGIKYPADDNMLIITARLNAVSVDAQSATVRVGGGTIWQQVIDAAAPHGLAPLLGTSPHVGVVGYTLGGGMGWLARRYGLAADSVRSIELVTPDGELRQVSATENSDLFWALRGSGGNFGVVTAMEFALYPVTTLYGGALTYPGALAKDALRFYREWTKQLPDEMTTLFVILKYPDMPQLPEAIRGKLLVQLRGAYSGDPAEGERWIQQWLAWQTPIANTFHVMPFTEVATINNDPIAPVMAYPSSDMVNELSDEFIDLMVRYATNSESPVVYSELRQAGGAIARANGNAISNRDASFYLQIGGIAFTPQVRDALESYISQYKGELRPYLHGGIYMNFAESSEARRRAQDAYSPESYARLVALKEQYDPENLFRYSFPLVENK